MTDKEAFDKFDERVVLKAERARQEKRDATLRELFRYHAPTAEQIPRYQAINEAALAFARVIDRNCPTSADRTAAIRLVQQARMFANASIALAGKGYR